jgi:hypothetical protein
MIDNTTAAIARSAPINGKTRRAVIIILRDLLNVNRNE